MAREIFTFIILIKFIMFTQSILFRDIFHKFIFRHWSCVINGSRLILIRDEYPDPKSSILSSLNENLFSCIIKKTFVYCFSIAVFVFIYKKHIKDITVSVFCRIVFHTLCAFNSNIIDQPEQKMTGCIDFIEVFVNK